MMIKQADVCLLFLFSEPDGPFQKKKRPVMVDRLCFHCRSIPRSGENGSLLSSVEGRGFVLLRLVAQLRHPFMTKGRDPPVVNAAGQGTHIQCASFTVMCRMAYRVPRRQNDAER
jgi:hypothetical protein